MTERKKPPRGYQKINPDDFDYYEEGFVKKGGGGGSGAKSGGRKGKKTLQALKRGQRLQSRGKRKKEVEIAILQVLTSFPLDENRDLDARHLDQYAAWIRENIKELSPLDLSEIEITFSKSGGPGGQNVNKRETKVALVHLPTFFRAESDQTRSQLQNKSLAMELLRARLQDHLNDWKAYLAPGQIVDLALVRTLLDKEG